MLYGPAICQSDCRKAGPYQLPCNKKCFNPPFQCFIGKNFFRGGGVTCICRDTGMCHYLGYFFGGCCRIFGHHFLAIPGFLGIIFW